MLRVLVYRYAIAAALAVNALVGAGWKWEKLP